MAISELEQKFRKYAIYSANKLHKAPIEEIFSGYELKPIGQGLQGRTFKLQNSEWVIKEGRWDIDISVMFENAKLPFPTMLAQKVLKLFQFTFLPDEDEIRRQYEMYLTFVQYFGYFRKDDYYYHENRDLFFSSQKRIRDDLLLYRSEIEKFFKIKLDDNIEKVLGSKYRYHNFLPKEYLLYGKSISPQNKGRDTYFIIQKFVEGELLHDLNIDNDDFSDAVIYQLIILIYLILLMRMKDNLLPDTRPRYPVKEVSDWLLKTDNIIVSSKRVTFVDTRWLWNTKDNIIKKGIIIPSQIERLCKYYISYLLEHV
ncbi:hypothetical protein H3C67_05145 [Candidatus Dojkabacteria bacterium]|uniref:Uncharacterized protein n=2 Tax=Candidatus Dojkabacteria TaxID=74243 RepID=A0A136KJ51_9BACT|nr:MAG: hypothetical protein UZ20_WS6002000600 [candidate division WS6 bacterium OLB21]MBW7954140.1 hypothetical protein [Candidatus Dojkabacteria bacterium]